MISEELPEHQIFHILRQGEQEPIGPYSQIQIVQLLNEGQIHASDFVYYPELSGWELLSKVFELHQELINFGDEGQEPHIVDQSYTLVESTSQPEERIYYIAVQHFPLRRVTAAVKLTAPKSIVLTDQRICLLAPKLMSDTDLFEYHYEQIESVMKKVPRDEEEGTFIIVLHSGEWVETVKIPRPQLELLERISRDFLKSKPLEKAVDEAND
ncbi:MAG: PH domain-containing protein [Akkermansiaceae bacterium]